MSFQFECEAPMGKRLCVRRHRLHNGLRLICLVDDTAPIVAYQTWFSVGSKNEKPGATGMAHLFEHLMFNQVGAHPVGAFDRLIEATGGDTNAATWVDWTYYRDSVPARDLALIVALEAERMTDLVLEPEVVEAEREVVMNERLQRVDDDVDGFAAEELFRHAFSDHPYHWPTIGWMEDIKSLSIPDIQAFYRKYYAPDNATLVVVGDFVEAELLALVEKHYGSIAASGLVHDGLPVEPEQKQERRFDYQKPVAVARLINGYKGPGQTHADWPVVSFACSLLAGGASSPLHRELVVEQEVASSISCDIMPFSDPSLIEISAIANRDISLDQLQDAIDAQLAVLRGALCADSEIEKVRTMVETEFWAGLTTMDGKAEALGHYQCVHGDFQELFATADRLAQVSAQEVQRVLTEYFRPERRTVIRIEAQDEDEFEDDQEDDA